VKNLFFEGNAISQNSEDTKSIYLNNNQIKNGDEVAANRFKNALTQNHNPKLWISIGLCFSAGNSMKGKDETSYLAVAPFSISLWQHFSKARVILWVVFKR